MTAVDENKSSNNKKVDFLYYRCKCGLVQCYDGVLQNAFAVGLTLQKVKKMASTDTYLINQLDVVIRELDEAINKLRSTIVMLNAG